MGKICKLGFLLFMVILLSGCAQKIHAQPPRLITGVHVTCIRSGDVLQRYYTDPNKMDAIMLYLTMLKPYGAADRNPERVAGAFYIIDVLLSDGQKHTYRQRADRYFSKDCDAWQLIDPKRAETLYPLLEHMQSDPL